MKALLSIHDVMPETRQEVESIVVHLERLGALPCTLLVVPGRSWPDSGIEWLRSLVARGFTLAGHGWIHETVPQSFSHRIHATVFSRNVAEHLAVDQAALFDLVMRCHAWFGDHGLPSPDCYVPPAWAMGPLPPQSLAQLPFTQYEFLTGILDTNRNQFRVLPLTGFEADTPMRAGFLRFFNAINLAAARFSGRPVRIAIHPHDMTLRLGDELRDVLALPWVWTEYQDEETFAEPVGLALKK